MKSIQKPVPGCGHLSEKDSFQLEMLTSDQSSKSNPKTSKATTNSTSLPALADGPLPCVSQAGPTKEKFGAPVVRVSRFRARDSEKAMPTNDICGPLFIGSSPSANLQRLLENKLRARMDVNGSPEYALTWKEWDMPSGVPICALRASARPIFGKGFTGWPSPRGNSSTGQCKHGDGGQDLQTACQTAGWPTPMAGSPATENYNEAGDTCNSRKTKLLCGWRTPTVGDARRGVEQNPKERNPKAGTASLNNEAALSGWASPSARDWKDTPGMATTGTNPDGSERQRLDQLRRQATLAGWATPDASVMNNGEGLETWNARQKINKAKHKNGNGAGMPIAMQSQLVSGPTPSGTSAETVSTEGFLLNPVFSQWLQGYPTSWTVAALKAFAK